jgi:hypothetical protein
VHDPDAILERAARTLDFSRPVALTMLGVLNFVMHNGRRGPRTSSAGSWTPYRPAATW